LFSNNTVSCILAFMQFEFSDCLIDTENQGLWKSGNVVDLEPQVFMLLVFFVERPGQLVSRDDIVEAVWGGRIVSDSTISTRINAVRRAIGDDDPANRIIETLSKRGYRLTAEVTPRDAGNSYSSSKQLQHDQFVRVARSADGTILAYATTGDGPSLMRAGHFLTHLNFDWESSLRRPLLDRFGEHFELTRFDQRGTGLSGPPETDFSLDRLVEDMLAIADSAGLEQFPIWASSQGVPVSIAFAAAYPERVSRMVLYGGFVQGRAIRNDQTKSVQAETLVDLITEGWGKPEGAFGKAYATLFMPDATSDQINDMSQMQLASATPEAAVALRRSIDSFDVSGFLKDVKVPVLVIHVTEDSVNPLSQSRFMASELPCAQLRVLEGRNHVPLPGTEAWDVIADESIRFLLSE